MKIITNNVPRKLLSAWELTEQELAEFDYYAEEELQLLRFVRYKGQCYCLAEFMKCGHSYGMEGWHGYEGQTAWSGVLVRYVNDGEVIMGGYYA